MNAKQVNARKIAADALDKVAAASVSKLLVWDPATRTLKAVSSTAKSAPKYLQDPLCLGEYDFGASLKDIIEDLETVLRAT